MKKYYINILIFLFLLLLNFVSHTFQYQNMGFYEDDFGIIARAANFDNQTYADFNEKTLFGVWPQGRPLGYTVPKIIPYYFRNGDFLETAYLFGLIIISINAYLVYQFLYKWKKERIFSILGAILFSLFPADTTKSYLSHIYMIQISITFILLSLNIFIKYPKARFLSYLLSLYPLLSYETPFALILLFPLFLNDKKGKKYWIKHILIVCFILISILSIRILMGENRVSDLGNWPTTIAQLIAGTVIGPVVSMGLFLYGPTRTVLHMNQELLIVMIGSFVILLVLLFYLNSVDNHEIEYRNSENIREIKLFAILVHIPEWIWDWMKSISIAALWLMSAYLLSFTHFPPVARYGRGTSVHAAATLPAAVLAALILWGLWKMISKYKWYRLIYVCLLALYFSVTIGNRYSIQQDFAQSWAFQKQFWREVVDLVPDVDDSTIIFVVNHNLPEEHYILSNTWTDYMILEELVSFPEEWKRNPVLLTTDGNWEKNLQYNNEKITTKWSLYWNFEVNPEKVIILTDDSSGHLIRINNAKVSTLSGIEIESMQNQETTSLVEKYPTTRLYELMIDNMK